MSLLPSDVKEDYTDIFINLQLKTDFSDAKSNTILILFGGVRRWYQPSSFTYVKASFSWFFSSLRRTSPYST